MADWRAYVREHLGSLHETQVQQEEVASELAGHMEEYYEALRVRGLGDEEAFAQTCARAGKWEELRRGIISAKQEGSMADRVRQFWVPSLVTLACSWGALAILIWAEVRPLTTHPGKPGSVILYVPWLFCLPLIGALGGYLSRRAQGSVWRIYVAGLFPALAVVPVFLLTFPFAFVADPQVAPDFRFTALVATTISWVILPGIALCLGVALQGLSKAQGANR